MATSFHVRSIWVCPTGVALSSVGCAGIHTTVVALSEAEAGQPGHSAAVIFPWLLAQAQGREAKNECRNALHPAVERCVVEV